jgi:hypothetical protein
MKGICRLWIIDKLSGISYIDAVVKETEKSTDGEFIGGLFTAINMFSAEALSESITALETESCSILFHIEDNPILAFLIDKEEYSIRIGGIMHVIHQTFLKKYPEVISGE